MKKILSLFFVFFIVIGVCFSVLFTIKAQASSVDDLEFILNSDRNSYSLVFCSENASGDLIIPHTYKDLPVTSIGDSAFENCTKLINITIPNSVMSIGDSTFENCAKLISITIPNSVTSLGKEAFSGCASLESITIPDTVTSIGSSAFFECSKLKSLYITDISKWCNIDFGSVDANPLYYAENLYLNNTLVRNMIIPEGVTEIKLYAFYTCSSITGLKLPKTLTKIGKSAFYGCSGLTLVAISDLAKWCAIDFGDRFANPLYYAKNLFLNGESVTNLIIPEGVTEIKKYAFYNCNLLTALTIPNGVTSLGKEAFSGCTSLPSVTIPNSVTSIGDSAFMDCYSLTAVYIYDLSLWCNIDFADYAANPLSYAENLYLDGKLVTSLVIPDNVSKIKDFAFGTFYPHFKSFTSVIIPESVTSIGYAAFEGCLSLTNVTIPNSVISIGTSAFALCYELTSIIIGDGVTSMGNCTFMYCKSLTSITIPDSITYISHSAFNSCYALTSVTIPDTVTSIGDSAFEDCNSLTNITIPNSVTSIDCNAFEGCTNLKYIFYTSSSEEWSKISIGRNNVVLTSNPIHYESTEHSHNISSNLPFFEGMEGLIEDICPVCDFVHRSDKLVYINDHITAVDTKNAVVDTTSNTLLLDMSACKDINEAIVEMDGYTLTTTPTSSYGFIGTGSKLKVTDSTGTQVAEYTLVVRGDVNGDSVCDVLDLMLIELARQTNNNVTLEGIYFTAANLAEDSEINIDDFNAVVNKAFV